MSGAAEESASAAELSVDENVTKYKLAAEIANKALAGLIKAATPGQSVIELCKVRSAISPP
jgi:methionine aminopeptidase